MFGMPLHTEGRDPDIRDLASHFDYEHLPEDLQRFSQPFYALADNMLAALPDSYTLKSALSKLLESKDCCVRAAVPIIKARAEHEARKKGIVDDAARFGRVTPENPMGVELPSDADQPSFEEFDHAPGGVDLPRDAGLHG